MLGAKACEVFCDKMVPDPFGILVLIFMSHSVALFLLLCLVMFYMPLLLRKAVCLLSTLRTAHFYDFMDDSSSSARVVRVCMSQILSLSLSIHASEWKCV